MRQSGFILLFFLLNSLLGYSKLPISSPTTLAIDESVTENEQLEICGTPLVAVNDTFIFFQGCGTRQVSGNVFSNDFDPGGDEIMLYFVLNPLIGNWFKMDSVGNFNLTIPNDFYGVITFEYYIVELSEKEHKAFADVFIYVEPDNDCDNISDDEDLDDDNDGILDIDEGDGNIDTDNDDLPDSFDIDSDNDGIPDNVEWQHEDSYQIPFQQDLNENGWDDAYDSYIGGKYYLAEDTNKDGVPDFRDMDSDNDGITDMIEGADLNNDGITELFLLRLDSDNDGLDDAFDEVCGRQVICNSYSSNSPLLDFDRNGIRDWRDNLNQLETSSSFVFPNPVAQSFTIRQQEIAVGEALNMRIYTLSGILLRNTNLSENRETVNVSDIKNGIYLITIKSQIFTKTQYLIISR